VLDKRCGFFNAYRQVLAPCISPSRVGNRTLAPTATALCTLSGVFSGLAGGRQILLVYAMRPAVSLRRDSGMGCLLKERKTFEIAEEQRRLNRRRRNPPDRREKCGYPPTLFCQAFLGKSFSIPSIWGIANNGPSAILKKLRIVVLATGVRFFTRDVCGRRCLFPEVSLVSAQNKVDRGDGSGRRNPVKMVSILNHANH
jgi:hypothetical protein